ncbi:MAG TPA: DNA translocase FtsK 4TM domain-containing protein, partial [Hyphomicrobiales bacterium]|nr:DNA translocase FtsK 4TM domain-containing protein [Hyphomicrobiales bacterium]
MSHYRISESGRILPDSLDDELPRLPMRLVGGALLLMAAVGWISLASWSFGDPSVNHAIDGSPQNLLGATGASLADILLQILGLASVAMFLPPAAWGLALVAGDPVVNARHRLAMWTASLILIASALSILPSPANWLLPNGMGGLIGDIGKSVFLVTSGLVSEPIAMIFGAGLAGLLGLWALMRASGIRLRDMGMLFQSGDEDDDGIEAGFSAGFFGYILSFIGGGFRWLSRLFASERPAASHMQARNFHNEMQPPHLDARILPRDHASGEPDRDHIWQRHFAAHGGSESQAGKAARETDRVEPYFEGHRIIPAAAQPIAPQTAPAPAVAQPHAHAYHMQPQAPAANYAAQQPQQQFAPYQPIAQQPAPAQPAFQNPQAYPQNWQPQTAQPVQQAPAPQYNPQHEQPVNGYAPNTQGAHQTTPPAAPSSFTPQQPAPAVPHYQQPYAQPQPVETYQPPQPVYANENFDNASYGGQI